MSKKAETSKAIKFPVSDKGGSGSRGKNKAALPNFLQTRTRSGESEVDPLLAGVTVKNVFKIGSVSRGEKVTEKEIDSGENQLLAIEAEDGSTIFIRSDKLAEDIERIRPDAIITKTVDGEVIEEIDFAQFRDLSSSGTRGGLSEVFWKSITQLELPDDEFLEKAIKLAKGWSKNAAIEFAEDKAYEVGSFLGAKALMWVIESRLAGNSGLYQWANKSIDETDRCEQNAACMEKARKGEPMLVLIHGTASYCESAFNGLRTDETSWKQLQQNFSGGIFAYEHRTFSQSPIENALELAEALPDNANLSIMAHSRGGLIADLLSLGRNINESVIQHYTIDTSKSDDVEGLLAEEKAERERLSKLLRLLKKKNIVVKRYIRVACPGRGTRFLSDNLDAALSDFATLIQYSGAALVGAVAGAIGGPVAAKSVGGGASSAIAVLKRLLLEIAGRRIDAHKVPGIAAMCIDSPLVGFLAHSEVYLHDATQIGVIAGDTRFDGFGLSNFRRRVANLFCDWRLFDQNDNDLVIDTDSMYAGLAKSKSTYYLYDQASSVTHFRYFINQNTREAMRDWMIKDDVTKITAFAPLTDGERIPWSERDARVKTRGGAADKTKPVLILVPGIMGSHLEVGRKGDASGSGNRIWFDPISLAQGHFDSIADPDDNRIKSEDIFGMFYGKLSDHLSNSYRVIRSPYDWRTTLEKCAEELVEKIDEAINISNGQVINIVAHSMGGLVVRVMMETHKDKWDKIVESGGRLVMLGTPNNGSHLMVHNLLGKNDSTRMLAKLDLKWGHNLQYILDIVSKFPGAVSLLPRPGFSDTGNRLSIATDQYYKQDYWKELKTLNRDRWFDNQIVGVPSDELLNEVKELWANRLEKNEILNPERVSYVFGQGVKTPCGVVRRGNDRLQMLYTYAGDGSVTWKSGKLSNLSEENLWYMPVSHGDLTAKKQYFDAIEDLVSKGTTDGLERSLPMSRGSGDETFILDAPPPIIPSEEDVLRAIMGSSGRELAPARSKSVLEVSVRAGDLRYCSSPVLCGHYYSDVISGGEAALDSLVDGKLTKRKSLDVYPDAIGTSTVVIIPKSPEDIKRKTQRGAIVVGLGELNGRLSSSGLTESVRTGVIQYLLRAQEAPDACGDNEIEMTSLLIGQNSTANISIGESLAAVVKGVCEANTKLKSSNIAISKIEFIELYRDIAITAAHSIRALQNRLAGSLDRMDIHLQVNNELQVGVGAVNRLWAEDGGSYWPRLIVTDADKKEQQCPAECYENNPAVNAGDVLKELLGDDYKDYIKPNNEALNKPVIRQYPDKLRYVLVAERARSESIALQRQPGLLENIVKKQVKQSRFNRQLARTLFELMIPHDSKPMMRELDRLVLQVDNYTANLPWELLQGDNCEPLVFKTAMVRQLATSKFRQNVRTTSLKTACIIVNPSTQGYTEYFGKPGDEELPPLDGADKEGELVYDKLLKSDYLYDNISYSLAGAEALDVLHKLLSRPYKILVISGHGVYKEKHIDGKHRTGVVLSEGSLITAAEIGQMEVVPELVFLNCCHIGQITTQAEYNRLAYSISQELIEIGVRCIVAAGWAVDDSAACHFADTFFEEMLGNNTAFGEAVFFARKETYLNYPNTNTWGAYQAYGDPSFRLDSEKAAGMNSSMKFTALEELHHELQRVMMKGRQPGFQKQDIKSLDDTISRLRMRAPSAWFEFPEILEMLGKIYADIAKEGFEVARDYYIRAISMEDNKGIVAIKTIEQLANMEARAGAEQSDTTKGEALILSAIHRLASLNEVVASNSDEESRIQNMERAALLGSAYKSYVELLICKGRGRLTKKIEDALEKCAKAYQSAGNRHPESSPYNTLNYLQYGSFVGLTGKENRKADIHLALLCADVARKNYKESGDFFDAVMPVDAEVTAWLLGYKGQRTHAYFTKSYLSSIENIPASDRQMDSVIKNLRVLAKILSIVEVKDGKKKKSGKTKSEILYEVAKALDAVD